MLYFKSPTDRGKVKTEGPEGVFSPVYTGFSFMLFICLNLSLPVFANLSFCPMVLCPRLSGP